MSCGHSNPAGYAFCGACGVELPHRRCTCGFTGGKDEQYCGHCGAVLNGQGMPPLPAATGVAVNGQYDGRYDLAELISVSINADVKLPGSTIKVSQDDISQLFKK